MTKQGRKYRRKWNWKKLLISAQRINQQESSDDSIETNVRDATSASMRQRAALSRLVMQKKRMTYHSITMFIKLLEWKKKSCPPTIESYIDLANVKRQLMEANRKIEICSELIVDCNEDPLQCFQRIYVGSIGESLFLTY